MPAAQASCQMLWNWKDVQPATKTALWFTLALAVAAPFLSSLFRRLWNLCSSEVAPLVQCTQGPCSAWLHNAQLLLICMIVSSHFFSVPTYLIAEHSFYLEPWLVWSSLFQMPAFSFVSGLGFQRALTSDCMAHTIIQLAGSYFFVKLAWWVYMYLANGFQGVPTFNPFDQSNADGGEWYLAVLIQWRLLIILLAPLQPVMLVTTAFVLGLGSGFWVSNVILSQHRALSFLPFFVTGYLFDAQALERVLQHCYFLQFFSRAGLVLTLVLAWRCPNMTQQFDLGHLGDYNYDYSAVRLDTGGYFWQGRQKCGLEYSLSWTHRAVRYSFSFIMVAAFLVAVPTQRCWLSSLGSRTMYPYLLHPWIAQWTIQALFSSYPALHTYVLVPGFYPGGWVWILLGVLAVPLTLFLSSAPVRLMFGWVIEPTWLASLILAEKSEHGTWKVDKVNIPDAPVTSMAMKSQAELSMQVPV